MDQILSPIKLRVIEFVEKQRIKKEFFYKKIGASSSIFKGKGLESELGGDKIVRIMLAYPDISPDWLLLGTGEMLRSSNMVEIKTSSDINIVVDELKKSLTEKDQLIADQRAIISDQRVLIEHFRSMTEQNRVRKSAS